MIIWTANGIKHIFTDIASDSLSLSAEWIDATTRLFEDDIEPAFTPSQLPTKQSIIQQLRASGKLVFEGDIPNRNYMVSNIFRQAICPDIINDEDAIRRMHQILDGQRVHINFSDAYVNSALAGIILTYLIKEIQDTFQFTIADMVLQLESNRRNMGNGYNDYNSIATNFPDQQSCDDFLQDIFEDVLGVEDIETDDNTKHHRWLRFESSNGYVELRPDHGIDGGWYTRIRYLDLYNGCDYSRIAISKSNYGQTDVVYYVIVSQNQN